MSTPSQRLWDAGPDGPEAPSLSSFLPERARHPVTLAQTASRIESGATLREAVADFLDDLQWARDDSDAAERIRVEPRLVDPHVDAYLAALAETVATSRATPAPAWSRDAARFLDHLWWPSTTPGLHARALVGSPAAFRRRGVFIGRTSVQRV